MRRIQKNPFFPERSFYTDLACERRKSNLECKDIKFEKNVCCVGIWESVKVIGEEGAKMIDRPCGTYDTLTTVRFDLLEEDEIADAVEEIAKKLCEIFDDISVMPARILVIGMGNSNMTVDSVGPKSAGMVKPTLQLRQMDENLFDELECSEIAVFCPDVPSHTGMDSLTLIKSVSEKFSPDAIIAIDSIMTSSTERLGCTIQISDTGIFPSGIGSLNGAITRATIGVPVIGIGVPTVMDLRYFKLNESEEIPLFVSLKETDEIVNSAAKILAGGINQAFGYEY